jgi:two-component system sensor histidine kinase AlgZ
MKPTSPASTKPPFSGAFDLCHIGVVLRAVALVHVALAVGALLTAASWAEGFVGFAVATSGALPATLIWLLLGCAGKRWWGRWSLRAQGGVALGLGALAGVWGGWQAHGFALAFWRDRPPVVGGTLLAGAGLAAVLFGWLQARAVRQQPADAAARLAELQSRIRPHFLFNTLNSAIALVRLDPQRAEKVLEDLAALFQTMLAEPGSTVTLAEEIELARRYLDIEQIRFGDRLQIDWRIDPAALQACVPPLLLQPLVENAVRHGIEPSTEAGWIDIKVEKIGVYAHVTITNTLPVAFIASPGETLKTAAIGHGIALANVRERLHLMHDVAAEFKIRRLESVFEVSLRAPVPLETPAPVIPHELAPPFDRR